MKTLRKTKYLIRGPPAPPTKFMRLIGSSIIFDRGLSSLGLLKTQDSGGILAFVSDVGLKANVVWSGGVLVSWTSAVARSENQQMAADTYKLVLRVGEGTFRPE